MLSSNPHTQPKFTGKTFRSLFSRPPGVGYLTSRFTRRYTLYTGPAIEEEFLDSADESDSEPRPSQSEPSQESNLSGSSSKRIQRRPPRAGLLDLPVEILEHIAASTCEPVPVLDAASRYIDERYSDFSEARFTLSAFSMVCSALRKAVERILYRDVQVDFTGWKGRKHTKWPAGSLKLLLRTLEERPELGRYIHSAALDYQLSSKSDDLEKGLEQFLNSTTNLKTLFLGQCPLALWDIPLPKVVTFATTYAHGILPSILEHFPKLENLHLRDCSVMAFSMTVPAHKLKTVRLDSSHDHAVVHFTRALKLCSDSVHHLDLRFLGGLLQPSPEFLPRSPTLKIPSAQNLHSLRLDNISIFTHTLSADGQLLESLSGLLDLHVTHHCCFAPDAFSILPPSLRTLRISEYYGSWEALRGILYVGESKNAAFLKALAKCIIASPQKILKVVASAGKEFHDSDLEVISSACSLEDPDLFEEVHEDHPFVLITFSNT